MPIPLKLDHVVEETSKKPGLEEQRALRVLAGIDVSTEEARFFWRRILDHKWYISERLGRDVGLRVAAVDYFENVWSENLWTPCRLDRELRGPLMDIFGGRKARHRSAPLKEHSMEFARWCADQRRN